MNRALLAIALLVSIAGMRPAFAADAASTEADLIAPVKKWIEAFNKGDTAAAKAGCADSTSIIDEFPPHEWHGAGACAKWMDDFDANAKENGITDAIVSLGKPLHATATGDRGYLVVPASYTYKEKGKPTEQTGATLTIAMQKGAAGWTITGWAWSTGK